MSTPNIPRGPGLFKVTQADGQTLTTNIRRLAGTDRTPGSALIAAAAWLLALIGGGALYVSFSAQRQYVFGARHQHTASIIEALLLDLLMIVFTLLALGLSRAGKSSRTERALILACAAASAYMNVSAADTASPRSVAAYAVAPIALAVVVDRVVAVIRRHVLGDDDASAWTWLGHAITTAARLATLITLYLLRTVLAPAETARGLRRIVLAAAPLPGTPHATTVQDTGGAGEPEDHDHQADAEDGQGGDEPAAEFATKKQAFLSRYRGHPSTGSGRPPDRSPPSSPPRPGSRQAPAGPTSPKNSNASRPPRRSTSLRGNLAIAPPQAGQS
jgi:uncharacterized protein DUF2637